MRARMGAGPRAASFALAAVLIGPTWATVSRAATFEAAVCPEVVGSDARVRCGWLIVPERRSRPAGRAVRLAVAVLRAPAPRAGAEPLLYVSGGPGLAALPTARDFLAHPLVTDRDLVLIDLRGTGSSQPSLACPEVDERALLGTRARELGAIAACRRRLRRAGVDLRAYEYVEMASDLADLRRALGIERWSVYGISNGGRLALELVRRHPDGIRSVVLDAALPPQGNFYLERWPHAQRAFDALFAACASNPACAGAFPDLEAKFWDLVDQLGDHPVTATVVDRTSGASVPVVFDDERALETLRSALYDTSLIPLIPTLLDLLVAGGGFDVVATALVAALDTPATFSLGQLLSVNCREEVAFLAPRALARQARRLPQLARVIRNDLDRARCRVWRVGRADASVDRPVESAIPALLLVGALDPVHPRESSELIACSLSQSRVLEFPASGMARPAPTRARVACCRLF